MNTPIYVAIRILGKKWALDILQDLFESLGIKNFNAIKKSLNGISSKILSQRLKEMRKFGLINRTVYTEETTLSVNYSLTKKGWDLRPVLMSLEQWSMNFLGHLRRHD